MRFPPVVIASRKPEKSTRRTMNPTITAEILLTSTATYLAGDVWTYNAMLEEYNVSEAHEPLRGHMSGISGMEDPMAWKIGIAAEFG